jgi:hypothetical protein
MSHPTWPRSVIGNNREPSEIAEHEGIRSNEHFWLVITGWDVNV